MINILKLQAHCAVYREILTMNERDKMDTVNRKVNEIDDITDALRTDEQDGYLLRSYVRRKLEDRLQLLKDEIREINNNIFSES
jgi:hypothetical protein